MDEEMPTVDSDTFSAVFFSAFLSILFFFLHSFLLFFFFFFLFLFFGPFSFSIASSFLPLITRGLFSLLDYCYLSLSFNLYFLVPWNQD